MLDVTLANVSVDLAFTPDNNRGGSVNVPARRHSNGKCQRAACRTNLWQNYSAAAPTKRLKFCIEFSHLTCDKLDLAFQA